MYNYDEKYYLTATVRVDGSSKFSKDNKWATFPSVSAAYRLTGEEFMKNQKIFDDIKIRAGWGKVGNQNIDNSAYLSSIGTTDYVFGQTPIRDIGSTVSGIGNPNLKWETVEDWNVGLDLALLQSRLKITADYFHKTSHDMLMKKDNLLVLGYPMWNGQMWENVGKMKATGWELGINWNDHISDFTYGVGLNLSQVKNKALKLNGDYIWTGGLYAMQQASRSASSGVIRPTASSRTRQKLSRILMSTAHLFSQMHSQATSALLTATTTA